jgi:hypothetical protein
MSETKVVSFKGNLVPDTASPDVIECIEKLLAQAKRGEIVAIGYAAVRPASNSTGWQGGGAHAELLLLHSAAGILAHRLALAVDKDGIDT